MEMALTTEDEFNYYKWRLDSFIIIQDQTRSVIHQSHCDDISLSTFVENVITKDNESYFYTNHLADGVETFQAELCQNCLPR